MDISTVLGLVIGCLVMALGIVSGSGIKGFFMFIDIPSAFIVVGGTFGVILIVCPMEQFLNTMRVMAKVFLHKKQSPQEIIEQMVLFATRARREGILALEEEADKANDSFLKQGIQLAVDGTSPEALREIMENELNSLMSRHKDGQNILIAGGTYAPAFGMIGTLIGLVLMLATLDNPDTIGPKMAVALITTFYGALIANFMLLPMAEKLKTRSKDELLIKEVMIEGILSIQSGDNPRLVEQKLNAFLAPKKRFVSTNTKEG
ncbi:MAG: MotA/TolQ/ExbB proton channel family protein [Candidatus Auribacterota bacterium]|jgi:chemotaxis protein MotA|uniref:Motility protein A n=1 Tax=Candidatus Auribacter fodinae TaxID=2093366 RepID=A0A3A4R845_9BACT|nr:MAG: motility protein A [Candidatus Auribacter fodinae]